MLNKLHDSILERNHFISFLASDDIFSIIDTPQAAVESTPLDMPITASIDPLYEKTAGDGQ